MKISIISSNATHEIRFFEFIAPAGWTITSFFQVVEKPNSGIGCVETYHEALEMIGYPTGTEKAYIHAAPTCRQSVLLKSTRLIANMGLIVIVAYSESAVMNGASIHAIVKEYVDSV